MKTETNTNYSHQVLGDEIIENTIFVNCTFMQTRFGSSQFKNCLFHACNFHIASFENSSFERCLFKSCDLVHAHFDNAVLKECYLTHSNFHSAHFDNAKLGVVHSEGCIFAHMSITEKTYVPATSREFIGEIIRQISGTPRIQAFGALVTQCTEFCWETIIAMGKDFLTEKEVEQVYLALKKYPNFDNLLQTHFNKEGLIYGRSS